MSQTIGQNLIRRKSEIENQIESEIKTGLVVQGGGMRGIYSMAALMAIEECNLSNAFDHVFGSSAGAINAAYLLAEQAELAVTVYLDDISNKNFVDFFRLRKIVDIDFLVDEVLKKHKALDVNKVMNSRALFHLILTDVLTSEATVFTNRDKEFDLMEALRATAALPILYNKIIQVNGRGYIDGGLRDAVPLIRAIEAGCTDIVVVLTREPAFRRHPPNFFLRQIEKPFISSLPKATQNLLLSEDKHFNKTMDLIQYPELSDFTGQIAAVYPSDMSRMVSRTTHDREALLQCALMARNDMRATLGLGQLTDNPFPSRP